MTQMPRTDEQRQRNTMAKREWRARDPEHARAIQRASEKRAGSSKRWKQNNPERTKELKRLSYRRHADAINARGKEQRAANRDEINAAQRQKYALDLETNRAKAAEYRQKNVEMIRARAQRYRQQKRAVYLVYEIQKRCKKAGIECAVTPEWVQTRFDAGICEMTGHRFDMEGKRTPLSPSIDRRNPKGPYTPENCRMIVWALNRAMSDHGEEFMLDLFGRVMERQQP